MGLGIPAATPFRAFLNFLTDLAAANRDLFLQHLQTICDRLYHGVVFDYPMGLLEAAAAGIRKLIQHLPTEVRVW